MDLRLALMCGTDIPVPECQLVVHQPTMREISYIGEEDFFTGVQTLCIQKNMVTQDESLLANMSNFQIFMTIMTEKETRDKRECVMKLFQMIFPLYKVSILPRGIYITFEGQPLASLDETNFEPLQQIVRQIFCVNDGPMGQTAFNPADEQAKAIAEKLMRGRQRVAAQNGQAQASPFAQYLSTLTVGLGSMSLHDCMNLTMYQLLDLVERYMLYVDWDIDIRSRLAGAKPESKPDNWMKNIH